MCLEGCWPDLLRSKQRNLARGGSDGKKKTVTDDFEGKFEYLLGDWRWRCWSGEGQAKVAMEVMGRCTDQM